jgi:hypothetical protein
MIDTLKESYLTNEELDLLLLQVKRELIFWLVGTTGLGVLINHFWK